MPGRTGRCPVSRMIDLERFAEVGKALRALRDNAFGLPKRSQVKCLKCGRKQEVDTAMCFRAGWPECCGETMRMVEAKR